MFELAIDMEPQSKLRARMGRFGAYTPRKTVVAEHMFRTAVLAAKPKPFAKGVPLCVQLIFYRTKPKSQKAEYPVVKPDLDNLVKLIDALNGVLWHDDAQIVSLVATKRYAKKGFIKLKVLEFSESVEQ